MPFPSRSPCLSRVHMSCECIGLGICPPPMAAYDRPQAGGQHSWWIGPALSSFTRAWRHDIVD
jgi:hypothetical protein